MAKGRRTAREEGRRAGIARAALCVDAEAERYRNIADVDDARLRTSRLGAANALGATAMEIRRLTEEATAPAPEPAPRRQRRGCKDLDSQWPGIDGQPRGPTLCVLYPDCECGEQDRAGEPAAPTPGEGKP